MSCDVVTQCPLWRRKVAGDLDHGSLGLIPDREGEIPGGKKRVEVKAFPRLKAGLSLNPNPNCAYFPPTMVLEDGTFQKGLSSITVLLSLPAGLQAGQPEDPGEQEAQA